jgi:phosphoglycolate phosphatase
LAYRLAIFDFDGTLADSMGWTRSVMNAVAERYGFKRLSDEEFTMLRGWDSRTVIRYLGVPLWKIPAIASHVRKLVRRDAEAIPLFDGAAELLLRLSSNGIILAIVSSNAEDNIRRILGRESAGLIRYYECGASIFGKAARLRRVVMQSGASPEEVICIGDEVRDIDAAASQGLAAGAVTWGYATAGRLRACRPTMMFESMDDISAALVYAAR